MDDAAEVLGVDEPGEFGPDQFLRGASVDPGGGRGDVAQDAAGRGDHDDVAGALDQGAEVVLLLGQFVGQRDVVAQHDALADQQGEHDGPGGEQHDPVDAAAVEEVVEDAQGADGGGQVGREGGERAGEGAGDRVAAGHGLRRERVRVRMPGAGGVGRRGGCGCRAVVCGREPVLEGAGPAVPRGRRPGVLRRECGPGVFVGLPAEGGHVGVHHPGVRLAVPLVGAAADPGGVGEEQGAGEPARVEQLAGVVGAVQQW